MVDLGIDKDSLLLDINDCEFFIPNEEIKDLERKFFAAFDLEVASLFGGTMGE